MRIFRTITTLLLAVFFAVATTGVSVVYHYCAGKLDSVSLFTGGKTCGCNTEKPQSCCKDEVAFHKLDTDCKPSVSSPSVQFPGVVLPLVASLIASIHNIDPVTPVPVDTSPPGTADIPVLTCSLLI